MLLGQINHRKLILLYVVSLVCTINVYHVKLTQVGLGSQSPKPNVNLIYLEDFPLTNLTL